MSVVPRLVVFTDDEACRVRGRGVVATLARALRVDRIHMPGHARDIAVVVRMKNAPRDDVVQRCIALRPITQAAGAQLLVHTHVEIVEKLAREGVRLDGAWLDGAATTTTVQDARARLPTDALIGVSRHVHDALDSTALRGIDVVTISPVYAPHSKADDTRATLGLSGLRTACARSAVPVLALGGVDQDNAAACLDAGAHGVAVIGAVLSATDPLRALTELVHACATR